MSHHVLSFSTSHPNWLPRLDLACTTVAAMVWLAWPQWGPWPLLLAFAPWLLRWWQTGRLTVVTPLAAPLCLFMITAVIGLWAAYNPTAAWAKFWLLVAAMFLFYTLANQPAANLWPVAKLFSLLTVLVAIYFLLTHDWQADPTYMSLLDGLADRWMGIRPSLKAPPFYTNQAAGFMVVLAPFGLAVIGRGWRTWSMIEWGITAVAAVLVLFALLLTGSRGAWLALAAALTLWVWSATSQRLAQFWHRPQPTIFGFGLGSALLISSATIWLLPGDLLGIANRLPGAASANSRATIFGNTLHLLRDFSFTGGGLDSFSGLYSQYVLVIPQRVFTYAHNLYLDVALEQGVLGLVALATILLASLWLLSQHPDRTETVDQYSLLRWAAITGLIVLMGRGLVDDAFYGNTGTPLLWLLPGFTVSLSRATMTQTVSKLSTAQWSVVTLVLLFSVAVNFTRSSWRAAWLANLGAVQMARVELANWPTNEWDDGRSLPALHSAEQHFVQALQIDPANRTAHHRLGMIEMLRRDYGTAVAHLEAAHQTDNTHPGIRKSLAYSYLWNAQLDKAQTLVQHIPEAKSELSVYTWWWISQNRDDLSEKAEQMLTRLEQ